MRRRGSCRLLGWLTYPISLIFIPPFSIHSLASHYVSQAMIYFLAELLCVGVWPANEVNMVLQAVMW